MITDDDRKIWNAGLNDIPVPLPECLSLPAQKPDGKRGFFRIVFGKPFGEAQAPGRKLGIDLGLDLAWLCHKKDPAEMATPFFVFGEDNHARLTDMGFTSHLLDKRPSVSSNAHPYSMFIHKFLAFEAALDMYDEAVYLDVDCERVKPLPDDFWEAHGRKSVLQAALFLYRKGNDTLFWRPDPYDRLKSVLGCYIYMRGKDIVRRLIDTSHRMFKEYPDRQIDDEAVMCWILDNLEGGWHGNAAYAKNHMPPHFMGNYCPYDYEYKKVDVFRHHEFRMARMSRLRRKGKWPLAYPFVGPKHPLFAPKTI